MKRSFFSLQNITKNFFSTIFIITLISLYPLSSFGGDLPQGPDVKIGDPTITTEGNDMLIDAGSHSKTWIDWTGGFNIGVQNLVNNLGPSRAAAILHNDISGDISNIQGVLSGNSNVFLLNPNGILFSSTAQVNVGSLVASTLMISQEDFLDGNYVLTADGETLGSVINQGTISALEDGSITLAGGAVKNLGTIDVNLGTVNLVSGNQITLDIIGNGNIQAAVDQGLLGEVYDQDGNKVEVGVENIGEITADGGKIYMEADAISGVFDQLVNQEGIVRAGSLVEKDGKIVLKSASEGVVQNTGTLDVSAIEDGAEGGSIKVLGDNVRLFGEAVVDASGDTGGGTVEIGGNFQGKGPDKNSRLTVVGKDVEIKADAGTAGDGGEVILWSDGNTYFVGDISAKGGTQSGDGGFVEVSGKENLNFNGYVNTTAANGNTGMLLLDPTNIIIHDVGDGVQAEDGQLPTISGGDGGAVTWDIGETAMETQGSAITLEATNDITINDLADNLLDVNNGGAFNLTINCDSDGEDGGAFSMNSGDTIDVTGDINISATDSLVVGGLNSNGSAINLNGRAGIVDINGAMDTGGGEFTSSGLDFDNTGGSITTSGGDVGIAHTGDVTIGANITAGAGNVVIALSAAEKLFYNSAAITGNSAIISADKMALSAGTIDVGANTVTLKPYTAGAAIDLGSGVNTAAGTVELHDNELDTITATTLRIGSNDSGAISVTADLTPANITNLSFISGAGVSQEAGDTITVSGLRIDADNDVSLGEANDVDTLAVTGLSAGENLTFNDADDIAINTVDGTAGVTVSGDGAIDIDAGTTVNIASASAASVTGENGEIDITATTINLASAGNVGTIITTGTGVVDINGNLVMDDEGATKISGGGGVDVSGTATITGEVIGTNSDVTFNSAVTLAEDTTVGSANGNVTFLSTVNGNYDLNANADNGTVLFDGIVGGSIGLDDLAVIANLIDVDAAIQDAEQITFTGDSNIGADLTTANGALTLNGDNIISGAARTLTATTDIDVNGDISGDQNLTLAGTNNVMIQDVGVAAADPNLLDINTTALQLEGDIYIDGNVRFNGATTTALAADVVIDTLNAADATIVDFAAIRGGHSLTIVGGDADVSFAGTTELTGLTVSSSDTVDFTAAVSIPGSIDITAAEAAADTIDVQNTIDSTAGSLIFSGPVELNNTLDAGQNVTINGATTLATGAITVTADSGDIDFNGDISGTQVLNLDAANGDIGIQTVGTGADPTEVDIDSLTAELSGATIDAGHFDTAGVGLTTLVADVDIDATAADGINLGDLGGAHSLTLSATDLAGNINLADANIQALIIDDAVNANFAGDFVTSGAVTVDAAITGEIDVASTGSIQAGGAVDFNDAVDIDINGTVSGDSVTLDTTGNAITLAGNLSAVNGNVSVTDDQVTVDGNSIVSSTNGGVTFGGAILDSADDTHTLEINANNGTATFTGAVGNGVTDLNSLTVTAADTLFSSTTQVGTGGLTVTGVGTSTTTILGDVTSASDVLYDDSVILGSDGDLIITIDTTTNNSSVEITGKIDGTSANTQSLDIEAGSGAVTLGDSIGTATTLHTLQIDTSGQTELNGAIRVGENLDLDEANDIQLGSDVTATVGNSATLQVIDGGFALSIDAENNITANSSIGATEPLSALTFDAADQIITNGTITSTGTVLMQTGGAAGDDITIASAVSANSVTLDGDEITINAPITGTNEINITAQGSSPGDDINLAAAADLDSASVILTGNNNATIQVTSAQENTLGSTTYNAASTLGANATAADDLTFNGAVTLSGGARTLTSTNGDIDVNADISGAQNLTLSAANGEVAIQTIGSSDDPTLLDINSLTAELGGATLVVDGAVALDGVGLTTLTAETVDIDTTAGTSVNLGELNGANNLTISAGTTVTLADADIASLDIDDATTVSFAGDFVTSGAVTVDAAITGEIDVASTGSIQAGGVVTLANNDSVDNLGIDINGTVTGTGGVTVTATDDNVAIDADVSTSGDNQIDIDATAGNVNIGQASASTISSVNGEIDLLAGTSILLGSGSGAGEITTTGSGNVDLNATTAFTMANASSKVTSGGTIDIDPDTVTIAGEGLEAVGNITVDATDTITVNGVVQSTGGSTALSVNDTDDDGTATINVAANLIGDDVTVTATDANASGEAINVTSVLNNNRGGVTLDATTGTVDIDSNITAQDFIDLSGDTAINLAADLTATDNSIDVNDALTLDGGTPTITSTSGDVTFDSTIDGAQALTVNSTSGTTTFTGAIGATTEVTTLTVAADIASLNANISSEGNLDFTSTDDVNLTSAVTIDSEAGNDGDAGYIKFKPTGRINGAYAFSLDAGTTSGGATGGDIQLGIVGNTTALSSLTVDNDAATDGTTTLYGNISTDAGNITFSDAPVIVLAGDLVMDTEFNNDANAGDVLFGDAGTIDGAYDLTIDTGVTSADTAGAVNLGVIGGSQPLNSLTVDSNSGSGTDGTVTVNGNITTTAGADFGDAPDVDIDAGITLTNSGSGTIDLSGGDVDAAGALDIAASGTDVRLGVIDINADAEFDVDSTGTTTLLGNITNTVGGASSNLAFDGATNVVLGADVGLSTQGGAAGNIDFVNVAGDNTLSGNFDLTLNSGTGNVELDNIDDIASLTVTDSTSTTFSGDADVVGAVDVNATSAVGGTSAVITIAATGSLTTTSGPVTLDADTEIAGTDATITVSGIINSAGALTLDADTFDASDTATIDINADVTGNLTMTSEDDVDIDGDVTATGSNPITLTADSDGDNTGDVNIGTAADAVVQSVDGLVDIDGENVTLGGVGTGNDGRVLTTGAGNVDVDTVSAFTIADTTDDNSAIISGGNVTVDSSSSTITTNGVVQSTSGSVALTAADDITLSGIVSADGDNGTVTITQSGAGEADITINSAINTHGTNGTVTILNSGAASSSDITLSAAITTTAGNVDIDSTLGRIDVDGAITANGTGTVNIFADGEADGDLDITQAIESNSGNITLRADDGITLSAAAADLTTTSGDVTITADVGTQAGIVTMTAGSKVLTAEGDIDVDADGIITVGELQATVGTVAVTSDSATVIGAADGTTEITAPTVDLDAATGIGAAGASALDLSTTTSLAADLSGAGDIYIDNAATGAVNVTSMTITGAGLIDYEQTGNQQVTLSTLTTTDGNITVNNTGGTSADVLIGDIDADTTDDTVTINAAGSINDAASDTTADITSEVVDLDAVEGIGNTRAVELASVTTIDADTTDGDIDIDNVADAGVTVNSMTTGTGNITYDQTGNQTLALTTVTVTDGDISIFDAGGASADITVYDINGDTTDGVVTLDSGSLGAIINDSAATSVVAYQLTISEAATVGSDTGADNTVDTSWLDVDVDRLAITTAGASYFDEVDSINAYDVTTTGELGINAANSITATKISSAGQGVLLDAVAGAITDGGDTDTDVTATSLRMTAETGIGSTNPIETAVTNLAAETEEGNLRVANTGSLIIDSPLDDLVTGLTITDTAGDDTGYYIEVRASSPLTVSEAVVNNDAGSITLAAEGNAATDDLTLAANVTAAGGNGDINLYAGHDVLQTAGTVSAAGSGDINAYAGRDYNGGSPDIQAGHATGDFTQTDGLTMQSTSGDLTVAATENAALSILTTAGNVNVTADDDSYSLADNSGAITDNLTGDGANIIGNIATLRAATGIGSAAAIMTDIGYLDALNTTSGNIAITEIAAGTTLAIQRATQQSPDGSDNDGDITIQTTNGTLTVAADQNGVTAVDAGTVTLIAGDSDFDETEDLAINDTVTSNSGKITLTSSGDDVSFGAQGDVTSTSAEIEVNAVNDDGDGVIDMADGTVLDAGTGVIDLNADSNIDIGSLVTNNTTDSAVTIDSAEGALTDAGDTDVDIVANSGRAVINTITGVGSADDIETTLGSIDIDNTTSGSIQIDETDALTVVKAVQATAGDISIVADGTITADSSGVFANVISTLLTGTISLDANGATSNIVLNDGLSTATGNISVTADNDITTAAEGDITSTSGDLTVTADADSDNDGKGGAITMADGSLFNAGTGTIDIDADENIALGGLLTTNTGASAVAITSTSGAITDGGDSHTDIVANTANAVVTIDAVKGVGTTDALETQVYTLDIDNQTDGDIRITEADDLLLNKAAHSNPQGPEDGDIVITTIDGELTVVAGAGGVTTGYDGIITLTANGDANSLNVNDAVTGTNGAIILSAEDDVIFGADGDVTSTTGDVTVTADNDGDVSGTGGALTMDDGTLIDGGSGDIALNADEDITLGGLLTTSSENTAVVLTTTSGGIVDGGDGLVDVVATGGRLVVDAVTGVGSAGNIDTTVDSIDIDNTTSGNIDINETDAVTVIQIDQDGAGTINLDAAGNITVATSADGGVGVTATSGQVDLDANGTTSDAFIYNTITTTSGNINIDADDDVTFTNAGDVTSGGAGNVTVTADADNSGAGIGGALFMADVDDDSTIIDAGTGVITLLADEDITLGGLTTANTANSSVIITTDNGSIVDGGDTAVDIDANTTADTSGARLTASTGIGTDANDIDTTIETLSATTATGDIHINNTGELDIIDDTVVNGAQITAGSVGDNITILAASPLNVDADVIDAGGGDILLAAEGTLISDDLTINDLITASGGNGNIDLYAGHDFLQVSGDVTAAGSGAINVYAGVDYNSGTPQAGHATADITQSDGQTISSTSGNITMTATENVNLAYTSTTGDVSITADDDTYSLSDNSGAITDATAAETALVTADSLTISAATGIGTVGAGDIDTDVTDLTATNSTSGDIVIYEINGADNDLIVLGATNLGTSGGGDDINIQTYDGTLTISGATSVADTTGIVTLIAGDNGNSYDDDLEVNAAVTSVNGTVTLTSSDNDVTFGSGGDVTTTSGLVDVNAESGAGAGAGVITMADGSVIDSGDDQIDMDAYGDITLGGLTTTYTADDAVAVTSVAGGIVDGGDADVDIVANTASATVDLDAETGIGTGNALETSIYNLDAANGTTSATSSNIKINETDAINLVSVINKATGSIDVDAAGTITTTIVTAEAGAVNLYATAGDILDSTTGTTLITAGADSSLKASGVIGSAVGPHDPVDVDIDGELWVWAGSEENEVSAILQGTVNTAASTERVEIYNPSPPGSVIFDNHLMGGGNYGSGSTGGSILSRGYGQSLVVLSTMFDVYPQSALEGWGFGITQGELINEDLLTGPSAGIDGSELGITGIPDNLTIPVYETSMPQFYIIRAP